MSEHIRNILLLIGKVLCIILLPVLFFSFIGEEATLIKRESMRKIAIVNEDLGAKFDKKPIQFGQDVSAVLDDQNSDYAWSIVNRSSAEKGLENQQYDAVIYIPSDFSNNIITFNEQTPIKANIRYRIQSQLDAKNREKIQKEIEKTKGLLNKQMSMVYWNVVSQEVDHIRNQFREIVQKEINFQKAMYDFYSPNSEKLSGQIGTQMKMLEELLKYTNNIGNTSSKSISQTKGTEEEVNLFVENVRKYKEYQKNQKEVLTTTQQLNKDTIDEGLTAYENTVLTGTKSIVELTQELPDKFFEDRKEMLVDLSGLKTVMNDSQELTNQLFVLRNKDIEQQYSRILKIEEEYRNNVFAALEEKMLPMREGLSQSSSEQVASYRGKEVKSTNTSSPKLDELSSKIAKLKAFTESINEENNENKQALKDTIESIESELSSIKLSLQQQEGMIQQSINELQNQIYEQNNQSTSIWNIVDHIKQKEQALLDATTLTQERKDLLGQYFRLPIQHLDMINLLQYNDYLSSFYQMVQHIENPSDTLKKANEDKNNSLQTTLAMSIEENDYLTSIKENLDPETNKSVEVLEDLYRITEEIYDYVNNERKTIVTELTGMEELATSITEELRSVNNQEISIEDSPLENNLDGNFVVEIQRNTNNDLNSLNELVRSLGERQASVNSYTVDVQNKVGMVQQKADTLNRNWAENVATSGKVGKDIELLLNNTMVDGQKNGFVFDYLSSPIQVEGDIPEAKKIQNPPVVILVITLAAGLIIGFFTHHYASQLPIAVHLSLFILLNITVGLIICLYGLNLYPLEDDQAIKWSVFTIVLLFACSSVIQTALYFNHFIGIFITALLTVLYMTPLLSLVLPNFNFEHPFTTVYMSIQYGNQEAFYPALVIGLSIIALLNTIPYMLKMFTMNREMAHEE